MYWCAFSKNDWLFGATSIPDSRVLFRNIPHKTKTQIQKQLLLYRSFTNGLAPIRQIKTLSTNDLIFSKGKFPPLINCWGAWFLTPITITTISLSHFFRNSPHSEKWSVSFKKFFRKYKYISCYLPIFSSLLKKIFRKTFWDIAFSLFKYVL